MPDNLAILPLFFFLKMDVFLRLLYIQSHSFSVLLSHHTSSLSLGAAVGITVLIEALFLFAVFGILLVLVYYCAKKRAEIQNGDFSFNNISLTHS